LQVLSIWTVFTSGFDIYCLHEATPGSSHTGYYIISFDFVYVGNWDGKGLPDFSWYINIYQMTSKYAKRPQYIPNDHTIYQVTTKFTK
jgi:hypothetical protein